MSERNDMSKTGKQIQCEEAIRMLLEYLDNELGTLDHDAMDEHLHSCRACYTRMEFEKRLKDIVKDKQEEKASDRLRERIKNITRNF